MANSRNVQEEWGQHVRQAQQQANNQQQRMNAMMQAEQARSAQGIPGQVVRTAQQPQQAQQQPAAQQGGTSAAMAGVSDATRGRLQQAQGGYQQSDAAQQAQAALQQIQAQKPQGYTSKYTGQLEGILQQLQGNKFSYDLNGDAFFNSLKDTKQELARQASMDAMGQAAGLTGGYGNSAAQAVANQAYQQGLLSLNDDAMNAYNLALQRYQMEQQGLGDQFNMLGQLENNAYGQYRDTVGDWQNERNYLTDLYNTEEDRGYNRWAADRDYYTKLAEIENAAYNSEAERQEAIRQFNANYGLNREDLSWKQATDERNYNRDVLESDRNYDRDVLESDRAYGLQREQFDYGKEQDALANQLQREQFEYGKSQDEIENALRQSQFDYQKEQDAIDNALRQEQFEYGKTQDEQQQQNWLAQFGLQQDQFEYGKQQDAQQQENWLKSFDYQQYQDALDNEFRQNQFEYQQQQDAQDQANWQATMDWQQQQALQDQANWEAQMAENVRQFNENLNWDKMSSQQKYAAEYALMILQNGQMPSEDMLQAAGLSADDASKLVAKLSGGSNGTAKTYYTDVDGNFYTKDKNGKFNPVDSSTVPMNARTDDSQAANIVMQHAGDVVSNAVQPVTNAVQQVSDWWKKLTGQK